MFTMLAMPKETTARTGKAVTLRINPTILDRAKKTAESIVPPTTLIALVELGLTRICDELEGGRTPKPKHR